jgi:DeoR family transcriptional regulator of aga operon
MPLNKHQAAIMQYLSQQGDAEVSELEELLSVSSSTIRRQLTWMEENGLLERFHGGARLPTPIAYELPYEKRLAHEMEAKRAIAAKAKSLLTSNLVIGISGGTTCTELARQLRTLDNITVVTNAVNIALELHGQPGSRLMVTGGTLNKNSYELVGDLVTQSVRNFHFDIAFLGVSGISTNFGFSMSDEPEAVAGRAFMAAAERIIIVADHSKVGKSTFARLCSLDDVDMLITDSQIAPDQLAVLEKTGLEVFIA